MITAKIIAAKVLEPVLRFVLGLGFLSAPLRAWLFSTATSAWEVLNAMMLLAFAAASLGDGGAVFATTTHRAFRDVGGEHVWVILGLACLMVAGLNIAGVARKQLRVRRMAGASQLLSWCLWWAIDVGYWASYPPLSPSQFLFFLFGAFCAITGYHILYEVERSIRERACGS